MSLDIQNVGPDRHARRGASMTGVSRATFAQALDLMPDAVFFVNAELKIVDVNAPAIGSSGFLRSELMTMSLYGVVADAGDGRLDGAISRLLRREVLEGALRARQLTKNGGSFAVQIQLQVVEDEVEPCLVVVVQSGGDPQKLDEMLALGGNRDFLTGLPTRSVLELCLRDAERRARRRRRRFAILFIDIDRFKSLNDANGHWAGDLMLRAVGERLRACVRPGDFVARYGGDEFVALVEDVRSDAEVERIAERIRLELNAPLAIAGRQLQVSASVGVAIGHPFSSATALVHQADQAMYRAKRAAAPTNPQTDAPQ